MLLWCVPWSAIIQTKTNMQYSFDFLKQTKVPFDTFISSFDTSPKENKMPQENRRYHLNTLSDTTLWQPCSNRSSLYVFRNGDESRANHQDHHRVVNHTQHNIYESLCCILFTKYTWFVLLRNEILHKLLLLLPHMRSCGLWLVLCKHIHK